MRKFYDRSYKLLKYVLLASLILGVYAWLNLEKLPDQAAIDPSLEQEPQQERVDQAPFIIEHGEYQAKLSPVYSYDIKGLVVEEYDSENWLDYTHKTTPLTPATYA